MPPSLGTSLPFVVKYVKAGFLVCLATGLRLAFVPLIQDRLPFLFFYPTILFAAMSWGRGPAMYALGFSAVMIDCFWLPPTGSLAIYSRAEVIQLSLYLLTGGALIEIVHRFSRKEKRLRLFLKSTDTALWVTKGQDLDKTAPEKWFQLIGLSPSEYRIEDWTMIVHPHDRAELKKIISDAALLNSRFSANFRILTGRDFYEKYEVLGVPVVSDSGTVIEWTGSLRRIKNRDFLGFQEQQLSISGTETSQA